ncbi:tegument protein VP22 [Cervid alphaherpesvirus 2]|uniref:Tegument protein VP22 n=1 Tax=Cervid alphaherpesvirus 2 TaxID=365327 RepID=A0A455JIX4_9ALPH|nr:tegument protein VP22 [Cervid alphaherpesvirus 2]AVT50731.1 tegument protein VP22 [Cervid alphaherpesvirus 2]
MARFHRASDDEDDYEYCDVFTRENSLYGYEPEPDDHVYEELSAAEPRAAPARRRSRAAAPPSSSTAAAAAPAARGRERGRPADDAPNSNRRPSGRASSRPRAAAALAAVATRAAARGGGSGYSSGSAAASGEAAAAPAARSRAPPGAGAVASGRPLAFSAAPKTSKSPWCGPTHAYNRTIFVEAVALVAAEYARQAASSVWDADPPKTNEQLDRLLRTAAIRILVCEGAGLLAAANDIMAERAQQAASARRTAAAASPAAASPATAAARRARP